MVRSRQPVKPPDGNRALTQDPARLRRRRMMARLTIRDLSAKAGVATGSISSLENGKQSARVTMLAALADALGCDVADLMPAERRGSAA